MYGVDDAGDLSSALQQILSLCTDKRITFRNYQQLESVALSICQTAETNAMTLEAQADAITQIIKLWRMANPVGSETYQEVKSIMDRIVASRKVKYLEECTDAHLQILCRNKTAYAWAVEEGLFTPKSPTIVNVKKRPHDTESDESGSRKRQETEKGKSNSCWACGRSGHMQRECSFVEQDHPDVNREKVPWSDSLKGKLWAAKGKDVLLGNQTLAGPTFDFEVIPRLGKKLV